MNLTYLGSMAINVGNVFAVFLMSIVLARITLVEQYGYYFLTITILTLVSTPVVQGLNSLMLRESARHSSLVSIAALYRWALCALFSFSALAAVLFYSVTRFFSLPSGLNGWIVFFGVLVYFSAQGLVTIHSSILRGKGYIISGLFFFIFSRNLIFSLMVVALFIFNIATNIDFVDALIINIMACGLAVLASWGYFKAKINQLKFIEYPNNYVSWMGAACSFSLIAGVQLLNQNIDFLLLGWMSGAEVAGLYKPAIQIASLVAFALTSINVVLHTRIASLYKENKLVELQKAINQAVSLSVLITGALFFCVMFFSESVLTFLFGDAFSEGAISVVILAMGQLINALIGPVAALLNMTGHERITIKVMMFSVVVNFMLCFLLIPILGMVGAACAASGAMASWNIILYFKARRLTSINTLLWLVQLWRRVA